MAEELIDVGDIHCTKCGESKLVLHEEIVTKGHLRLIETTIVCPKCHHVYKRDV